MPKQLSEILQRGYQALTITELLAEGEATLAGLDERDTLRPLFAALLLRLRLYSTNVDSNER